jgi:hypothetical protein
VLSVTRHACFDDGEPARDITAGARVPLDAIHRSSCSTKVAGVTLRLCHKRHTLRSAIRGVDAKELRDHAAAEVLEL